MFLMILLIKNDYKIETVFDQNNSNKNHLYKPTFKKDHIHEINLIYIGSSNCGFSNSDLLYETVDSLKAEVQNISLTNNVGFSAIGIAAEWGLLNGVNHLNNFGYFDEIIIGNNWYNNGIIKYVGELGEEPSIPKIILTFKTYAPDLKFHIVNEKKILSLTGEYQIVDWFKKGTPLPEKFEQELLKLNEHK